MFNSKFIDHNELIETDVIFSEISHIMASIELIEIKSTKEVFLERLIKNDLKKTIVSFEIFFFIFNNREINIHFFNVVTM